MDDASPATDLDQAWGAMRWRELPGRYALAALPTTAVDPDLALALGRLPAPAQVVLEEGEVTVLAEARAVHELLALRPAGPLEDDLLWIRFEAPMAWEVVGFLARVTGALAAAGVPLGAVCSYRRDHLFVAARHRDTLRRVLGELLPEARDGAPGPAGAPSP